MSIPILFSGGASPYTYIGGEAIAETTADGSPGLGVDIAGEAKSDTTATGSLDISTPIEGDAVSFTTATGDLVTVTLYQGAGAQITIHDKDDPNGPALAYVPFEDVKFEEVLGEVGSAEVRVLPGVVDAVTLHGYEHIWKIAVEGVERFAFLPEQIVSSNVNKEERKTVRVVGRGVGQMLDWAAVYPSGGDVLRVMNDVTAGGLFKTLLDEAHARGTITDIVAYGWNEIRDSKAVNWGVIHDLEFNAGGSLLAKLNEWWSDTFEWRVDPDLRLHVAQNFGRDLSNLVILYPGHTVTSIESTVDRRDIRNVLMLEDGNEGYGELSDGTSVVAYGRREQYVKFDEAIDEGTRTALAYPLLRSLRFGGTEERVSIVPAPGRRPFVDFALGDTVGVKQFGDETGATPFRVLAIAYQIDKQGREQSEVTLDYMLGRKSLSGGSPGGGGGSGGGPKMLYGSNSGVVVVAVGNTSVVSIPLIAFRATYGKTGITLFGQASASNTLLLELVYDTTVVQSWRQKLQVGSNTIGIPWLWTLIPEGEEMLFLRLSMDAGTFTILEEDAQLWIEAYGIAGTSNADPNIFVVQEVGYEVDPSDTAYAEAHVPIAVDVVETDVAYPPMPLDSASLQWILDHSIAAVGDDGWTDDQPSWVPDGDYVKMGNDAADLAEGWLRFVVPFDLTGKTVLESRIYGTADQTDTGIQLRVYAVDAASPAAPTSRVDLLGRTLTTTYVDWDLNATFGVKVTSPDLAGIVQELVDSYGNLGNVMFVIEDRGGPINAKLLIGSLEHITHPAPQLKIRYQD